LKRLVVLSLLFAGIALPIVRCSTPEGMLRYRRTIEVQAPSGVKSGSSVLELALNRQNPIPLPGAGGADWGGGFVTHGEAPFHLLDNGEVHFVALRDKDYRYKRTITDVALSTLRFLELRRQDGTESGGNILNALVKAKTRGVAKPSYQPMLARFANVAEPKSIVWISPDRPGAGYAVSAIALQVVDRSTPLTRDLSARFPALAADQGLLTLP
jgi:hypothetical protein